MSLISGLVKAKKQEEVVARKEGQLAVDVYETVSDVVIVSPIAGVSLEGIKLSVADDVISISGERKSPESISDEAYYSQECFWGPFSRSIILPTAVDTDNISASFKDGILTVKVPKNSAVVHKTINISLE